MFIYFVLGFYGAILIGLAVWCLELSIRVAGTTNAPEVAKSSMSSKAQEALGDLTSGKGKVWDKIQEIKRVGPGGINKELGQELSTLFTEILSSGKEGEDPPVQSTPEEIDEYEEMLQAVASTGGSPDENSTPTN